MNNSQLDDAVLRLQWSVPNRVLYIMLQGVLDEKHALPVDADLIHQFDHATSPIHVLIDVTRVRKMPTALLDLEQSLLRHPRLGWIITIGLKHNPVVNFGISALSLKTKIRHRDCSSFKSAVVFLMQKDSSLSDCQFSDSAL